MKYSKNTLFVLGTARLGKTDPILVTYENFFIGIIIDEVSSVIIDTTCNMVKEKTADFINSILVGNNLENEVEKIEEEIRHRYHGTAQKAIIAAVKDARNKYLMIKKL